MTFVRFAPQEIDAAGVPLYITFINEVNDARPGTFGEPEIQENTPRRGYQTEKYEEARVIHGPGDDGIRVCADSDNALAAFKLAAERMGIHIAGLPEPEIIKTQRDVHIFHYVTHTVVWTIDYNPTKQDFGPAYMYQQDAQDGGELFVWCDLHLTREAAEERHSVDDLPLYFSTNRTIHDRTSQ